MANYSYKYFSGGVEVRYVACFASRWLSSVGAKKVDSFSRYVGAPFSGADVWLPIDRVIEYKKSPSLHVCDARCQNARGHVCECSCGGLNHGRGAAAVSGQGVLL